MCIGIHIYSARNSKQSYKTLELAYSSQIKEFKHICVEKFLSWIDLAPILQLGRNFKHNFSSVDWY